MIPRVYLETSFVSYLSAPLSGEITTLQRQLSSQRWWEQERHRFDLVVSQTVYEECARGHEQAVQGRFAILQETTLLPLTREILEVAKRLVYPGPFPRKAEADALHVAAATVYGCEFLLTWNFGSSGEFVGESAGIDPPATAWPSPLRKPKTKTF
jgi:hypothetical protein